MSEKYMNNAAFSNIQKLFSEPVNTICFAMKHGKSNEIDKYLRIYAEITVLYTIEMLSILKSSFRSSSSLFTENASDVGWRWHVEPMSETVRKFFLFSARKERLRQNLPVTNMSYLETHLVQSIFSKRNSLSIGAGYLFEDSLKQQTAALKGLHAIICLIQTGILWWNDVAVFVVVVIVFLVFFFHQRKKGFTRTYMYNEHIYRCPNC